jgi:hypothetical protein
VAASTSLRLHLLRARVATHADLAEVGEAFRKVVAVQPRLQEAYQSYYDFLTAAGESGQAVSVFDAAKEKGINVVWKPASAGRRRWGPAARDTGEE